LEGPDRAALRLIEAAMALAAVAALGIGVTLLSWYGT
jgi:hypothetical protein